ncbi:MAG TPA: hypothetical protein VL243_14955 [Vicinamibacterales bacterium]|nr:hypothetical protein [Vicinamibacterales bacterium]
MRKLLALSCVTLVALGIVLPSALAQGDADRVIPGGGISVAGWVGKIDPASEKQGRVVNDAKFAQEGANLHVTTGPAITYWNPANKAAGDYTVKATFTEPKYMALNSHPHSYGIVIGGNDLGTDQQSLLYCAAYGNGTFIVRGFGPAPFQMNGRMGAANPAVHKAAAQNEPVTQEIAWTVKGGRAECSINGTMVAGYDKAEIVGPGKLKSTDGIWGLRFTHNVEALVAGLGMSK